jgi:hypothetical protein
MICIASGLCITKQKTIVDILPTAGPVPDWTVVARAGADQGKKERYNPCTLPETTFIHAGVPLWPRSTT